MLMFFSYAIALGHDAIPHHHLDNVDELAHHQHHPLQGNHDNVIDVIGENSAGHQHHLFCHYSHGDSNSLAGTDLGIKLLLVKKIELSDQHPSTFEFLIAVFEQPSAVLYTTFHFADSSSHLLSSGLRAPPSVK